MRGGPRSLKHIYNRAYVHTRFVRKPAAGEGGEEKEREALVTELSIDNMRPSRDWQRGHRKQQGSLTEFTRFRRSTRSFRDDQRVETT